MSNKFSIISNYAFYTRMNFFWLSIYSQPSFSSLLSVHLSASVSLHRVLFENYTPARKIYIFYFTFASRRSVIRLLFCTFFPLPFAYFSPYFFAFAFLTRKDVNWLITDYRRRSKSCSLASLCIAFSSWRTALLIYSSWGHESDVWTDESH